MSAGYNFGGKRAEMLLANMRAIKRRNAGTAQSNNLAARNAAEAARCAVIDAQLADIVAEYDCSIKRAGEALGLNRHAAFNSWRRVCKAVGGQAR